MDESKDAEIFLAYKITRRIDVPKGAWFDREHVAEEVFKGRVSSHEVGEALVSVVNNGLLEEIYLFECPHCGEKTPFDAKYESRCLHCLVQMKRESLGSPSLAYKVSTDPLKIPVEKEEPQEIQCLDEELPEPSESFLSRLQRLSNPKHAAAVMLLLLGFLAMAVAMKILLSRLP